MSENAKSWKDFGRWARAAGIRAFKTFCQTLAATLATTATFAEVNWPIALSASGMAALLSLLTSCAGLPELQSAEPTEEAEEDEDEG